MLLFFFSFVASAYTADHCAAFRVDGSFAVQRYGVWRPCCRSIERPVRWVARCAFSHIALMLQLSFVLPACLFRAGSVSPAWYADSPAYDGQYASSFECRSDIISLITCAPAPQQHIQFNPPPPFFDLDGMPSFSHLQFNAPPFFDIEVMPKAVSLLLHVKSLSLLDVMPCVSHLQFNAPPFFDLDVMHEQFIFCCN